ncbi:MAG: Ni/Fe-hydrogenase, b-type cytochrome subunit [Gemmatimonadales bacterium]|nr:MAG: Ni/Fe-hydrogenase, b-type cytochrome subunit [Gemmatimonadales bacterium]
MNEVTPSSRQATRTETYRWVDLWGWPIRAMHWLAALCIVMLLVTGFYIGRPYFMTGGEASQHYLMGWARFLHLSAGALLVATAIIRFYWLFKGNRFERWSALFPVRPKDWVNLYRQIKYYLLIRSEQAPKYLGHNPLQQLSYSALYGVALVMVVTGFAMYGQYDPAGFFYKNFGWVTDLLGGIQMVRFLHHILAWVFLIFIPVHVYLALRADLLEHTGVISSIITGGRFARSDVQYEDEQTDAA